MTHPLILHPDAPTLTLPPQLCGSVAYYALMSAYPRVHIADNLRYDKRYKSTHRYTIADPHGPLTLTVPLTRPAGARCWSQMLISEHGHWWSVHARSLATAYGASPFYEYYIDRFMSMLSAGVAGRYGTLTALTGAWDSVIRDILGIPAIVTHDDRPDDGNVDCAAIPQMLHFDCACEVPYYRVPAADRPSSLTILDLIFNQGPEAPLYLRALAQANGL